MNESHDRGNNYQMGIQPRTVWTVAAFLWLVPGLLQLATFALGLTAIPLPLSVVLITGVLPLVMSAVWFRFARLNVDDIRLFHLPVALGLLVIVIGNVLDPNEGGADAIYPMLPMIFALVLFPWSHAWPYVIAGVLGSAAFVATGTDPTPWVRVVVTISVALTTASLLAIGQKQQRAAMRRNHELSEADALTGLANVRRLRDRLAVEIARERGDAEFALLTLDLDDFKAVNDGLGHSTGDRVLVEVARAIESCLLPGEIVARRGGDEFTVVMFPQDERTAETLRERIAAAIKETRVDLCPAIEPGASIGVAYHIAGEPLDALLVRADRSLHDAKRLSHLRRGRTEGRDAASLGAEAFGVRLLAAGRDDVPKPWDETHAESSWRMLAGLFLALASIVPAVGIVEPSSEFLNPAVFATCLFAAGAGIACMSIPDDIPGWIQSLALAGSFGVALALVAFAGPEHESLADLLVLPSLIAFYISGVRIGAAFAAIAMTAYIIFLESVGSDLLVMRAQQTLIVVVLVGYLVPHAVKKARESAEENERLAGIDPLTGLANLRRMNQRLDDELDRARSVGGYTTVFMVDLDDFKTVNDRHDHRTGDAMLIAVGQALVRAVRDGDLVARRGGDEFVAIVPHTGDVDPEFVAGRIEFEVIKARKEICPAENPDVSVGWVSGRPGDSAAELIARADAAEKRVKQAHRGIGGPIRVAA